MVNFLPVYFIESPLRGWDRSDFKYKKQVANSQIGAAYAAVVDTSLTKISYIILHVKQITSV